MYILLDTPTNIIKGKASIVKISVNMKKKRIF